jgi:hypothetical protein
MSELAIARMNFLHKPYRMSGSISQPDLLYTLSVFITEPIRWIERYEWRSLNDMEICALGTFWKTIGDNMEIDYSELARYKDGWRDGIEFAEDITAWAEEYEKQYMVPDVNNKTTADRTTHLLLNMVPEMMKPQGINAVSVLMGDRLRNAMMSVRL